MKKLIVLLLSTSLLTACGWHLRGAIDLPDDLNSIYLSAEDSHGSLINDLRRVVESNHIAIAESASAANYSITLLEERSERRAASVGGNALASEYELTLEVDYSIAHGDEVLLDKDTARAIRTYDYNENQVLGKNEEENIIREELRNELIQQIVRRLRFLATKPQPSLNSSEQAEAADGQTAS